MCESTVITECFSLKTKLLMELSIILINAQMCLHHLCEVPGAEVKIFERFEQFCKVIAKREYKNQKHFNNNKIETNNQTNLYF